MLDPDLDMDHVQLAPAVTVLSHSTCVDSLYPHLSVKDILSLQRVCSAIRHAVQNWIPGAYNINKHFQRFFDNPLSFRVLQAQTEILVSGSDALQFFDRTYYPESDIDLYVPCRYTYTVAKWLQESGYDLRPSAKQLVLLQTTSVHDLFEEISSRTHTSRERNNLAGGEYGWASIEAVFTFVHQSKPHLKAQLVVADPESSPIACVLQFHSTLVMNFIAWDKAYSLFPSATFLDRIALTFGDVTKDPYLVPIYAKYSLRGYKITAIPLNASTYAESFVFSTRWIDDKHSWVINLATEDVTAAVRADYCGEAIPRIAGFILSDKKIVGLDRNPDRFRYNSGAPAIYFEQVQSTILKNALILPMVDQYLWKRLTTFLYAQERFQEAQAKALNPAVDLALNVGQIEPWNYWGREILGMVLSATQHDSV